MMIRMMMNMLSQQCIEITAPQIDHPYYYLSTDLYACSHIRC